MSLQRSKDTAPELAVRRLLHTKGIRYRVGYRVPGFPRRTIDIAFPKQQIAVFIDGCFWHGCRAHKSIPVTHGDWWKSKIAANRKRDAETDGHLQQLGWQVFRFWEHDRPETVSERVSEEVLKGHAGRVRIRT